MAAVLHIPIPGRPGSRQQDKEAGPRSGAGKEEQVDLGPQREPLRRLQERAQASRGPCGRANGISPRGTRSARPTQSQVKSLAAMEEQEASRGAQGCQRNLSSRRRQAVAPTGSARKQRSGPDGKGCEAEQPRQARSELVPPPPPSGDASAGEQARHDDAAASEQLSDTGSSDESSTSSLPRANGTALPALPERRSR